MARAGGRAGKVLSSGRLSLPVRPAACKKRAAVRKTSTSSVDSGHSLCSTDSEDQVLDINQGLDRCAALLQDILQCDVTEIPLKPHKMPFTKGNVRPSTVKAKKNVVRKPTTAPHIYKEKGPLRRTLHSGLCNAESQRPCVSSQSLIVPSQNLDPVTTQMQRLNQAASSVTHSAPPAQGPEASALFNCRLPTSTPSLSPQHSANPQISSNFNFHQTLPPGGVSHFPSSMPSSSSAISMVDNIQASIRHNSTVPPDYQAAHQADILSQLDNYKSLIRDSDLLQCVAAHLAQLQQSEMPLQNRAATRTAESGCEREGPPTETDEDEAAREVPVRQIICQTSSNQHKRSPEKTEKKIKTVKYLLGEIKSLVADQGGGEANRLVTELERSVTLLPGMVGSTNVHAEIALALQPLRSENAQLRRRLRIVNQQLRDRERSARTDEQNFEDLSSAVTSLQSMNETLQHQLNESQKGLKSLQSKNQELLEEIEVQKEERGKTAQIIHEREQEILNMKQQNKKTELEEAVGKMKSVQFKLEASEKENQILGITVRQRDAEVTRLRELTRTLQASMAKLLCNLGKDTPRARPGSGLTEAALGSYEKQVRSEQCPASTSIMNYLKRLETDQVFTGTDTIYSDKPVPPTTAPGTCDKGANSEQNDDYMIIKSHVPQEGPSSAHLPVPPYSPHKQGAGSESCYFTSDDPRLDETMYLPLGSSPCKGGYDSSLRWMCTPPKVCSAERDPDPSCQSYHHNGLNSSDKNLRVHKESQYTSDPTSKAHQRDSWMEGPPPKTPSHPYPPPELQQTKSLQVRDDPPSARITSEGKSDWTICSFSTFTSHDEQDFRNGLAALDANIAKLQKTLQHNLPKK
ncbi:coiled-coil domain-containing protein 14 isoform X3 [Rhinoderma darwinii]|uniref:coiled-coil domain-containing protein 14 isoform X3 n=1 Tax=Rhinoderma darwinii TaxID=43563 RepID=UPI003F67E252